MRSEDPNSANPRSLEPNVRSPVGHLVGGKYQVLHLLGQGGIGAVYCVRQVFLNKDMALKLLDSQKMADGVHFRRFQQEAKAAFSLNHPSLVKVHDFGVLETGQPYLVMDLVEGETLSAYLKANGHMSLKDVNAIFAQVCFGLSYAHNEKVVHRDIKPSNIMLLKGMTFDTEGSVKIVDFGLAKMLNEGEGEQALTRTGEVMGSPIYMSPEQCSGGTLDYRSDIYSLGCVLFEILTGTPPFVGETALRTMNLHQTRPAPTLKEASLGKDFPAELEAIVAKMLKKHPGDRYQDLGLVAHELAAACRGSDRAQQPLRASPPRPAPPAKVTRTIKMTLPQVVLMMACMILGTVAVTVFAMRSRQLAPAPTLPKQIQQKSSTGDVDQTILDLSAAEKLYYKANQPTSTREMHAIIDGYSSSSPPTNRAIEQPSKLRESAPTAVDTNGAPK